MRIFLVILALWGIACQSSSSLQQNSLSEAEKNGGWQLLFDGKTTNGWHNYGREGVKGWAVEDGNLIALGKKGGGDIISNDQYADFDLRLEWKVEAGANSGVFFRVIDDPARYKHVYETGPEYQLIDDEGWEGELEESQKTAANYAMHWAEDRPVRPAGEWNETRILVQGRHVEHWLNGEKILEYELWTDDWEARVQNSKWKDTPAYGRAQKGYLALQDHGKKTWFRNIKIRTLPAAQTLFNGQNLEGWKVHGTEKWYVEDNLLICESGPDEAYGYLATEQIMADLDLELEFKQEADGNSGVFFRSSLEGTKISGWQVEVAPPNHDTGGVYESYGRGWLVQIDEEEEGYLKMGEWNHLRVRVVGDRVQTWLNGHAMVDFTDQKIGEAEGSIALQIHDGGGIKVRWRNLKVRIPVS
jgi:hypothetical protein